MTAEEIVNCVESSGGWLKLTPPDHIRVNVPEESGFLIDEVRRNKPAVVEVLRRRGGWVAHFPRCPVCGSYALFRDGNIGDYECLSCCKQDIPEAIARSRKEIVQ